MKFEVTGGKGAQRVEVERAGDALRIQADAEQTTVVRLAPLVGSQWWRLDVEGHTQPVRICERGGDVLVTVGPTRVALGVRRALPIQSRRAGAAAGDHAIEVRAPMPGLVVAMPAAAGSVVAQGAAVAIVEAMKMQMEVPAPAAGRVEEVRVRPGQEVAGGQVLVIVRAAPGEPEDGASVEPGQ